MLQHCQELCYTKGDAVEEVSFFVIYMSKKSTQCNPMLLDKYYTTTFNLLFCFSHLGLYMLMKLAKPPNVHLLELKCRKCMRKKKNNKQLCLGVLNNIYWCSTPVRVDTTILEHSSYF